MSLSCITKEEATKPTRVQQPLHITYSAFTAVKNCSMLGQRLDIDQEAEITNLAYAHQKLHVHRIALIQRRA